MIICLLHYLTSRAKINLPRWRESLISIYKSRIYLHQITVETVVAQHTALRSPVRVSCDLVAHHDAVHQPFSQQAGVVVPQLHRGQLPQVLTLDTDDAMSVMLQSQPLYMWTHVSPAAVLLSV